MRLFSSVKRVLERSLPVTGKTVDWGSLGFRSLSQGEGTVSRMEHGSREYQEFGDHEAR
jgi:DUF438 domain-containing protein